MKRFLTPLSVALVALWLMPQTILADCDFTPNLFPGQAADRTALEVNATVKVGEWGACTTHMYSQISALTSSNPSVVQVYNQGGYDAVFFVGVGTADVTYTENWFSGGDEGGGGSEGGTGSGGGVDGGGSSGICSTNHTIHYTVTKGTPNIYFADPEKGDPTTEYTTTTEARRTAIFHLHIKQFVEATERTYPQFQENNLGLTPCTVTSSNPDVATVGRGNYIQPTGTIGETTITATWAGNDNWNGGSASYVLKVEKTKQYVSLSFSQNQVSDTLGKVIPPQVLNMRPTVSPIRWWSSQPSVASIDENTGEITTISRGQTWIHAVYDGDDDYYAAEATYCLTVLKKDPKLSFAEEDMYHELGVPFTPQTLTNPFGAAVTWSSSDQTVATINADGTGLTLLKVGATIISAKTDTEDPTYEYVTASYSLHVTTLGLTVLGVNVTSLNADDILGDGKVSFDKGNRFLYLDGWNVDVSGMSEEIKDGVIKETTGMLTIMLKANSSIVGAEKCIDAHESGVYIRSLSKKDTLILRADASENAIAVWAQGLKMHEALFYTYGSQFAVMCQDFNVTKYGHVFAQATNEAGQAVMCSMFTKGEGGIGGIDILTPDIYWNDTYHAFWNDKTGKSAKQFEIGKVPMPVSSTDETKIEFTDEVKPEDHDNVVFSEGEDDKYNGETKEIEVTTSLTEEQVEEALEDLVPGSSEWVETLPGTIIFDLPVGKGEIAFECTLLEGYSLDVKESGKAAVSIKPADGYAIIYYDIEVPTRVIVYLRTPKSNESPRRSPAAKQDAPILSLKSITITPNKMPSGIEQTNVNANATKFLQNGQIYIFRDGKIYNVLGAKVK